MPITTPARAARFEDAAPAQVAQAAQATQATPATLATQSKPASKASEPSPAHQEAAPAFSPLYRQIKDRLKRSLQGGEWKPGDAIPSEIELAQRFRVSQGTVRKAVDELATENLLVRRQGKGTFVATHAEEKTQYRFLRLTPDDALPGAPATVLERRLLECKRVRAPAEVARALELKSGDPVVWLRRLLLRPSGPGGAAGAAGPAAELSGAQPVMPVVPVMPVAPVIPVVPVVLDDLYLNGALFKGLSAERMAAYKGPMYRMFEAEFAVHMTRAEERIRAVSASESEAALLQVAAGAPLLSVDRLCFTYGDRPVEFRKGVYSTQHHHYRNELM
jgi:GntR family transcriptional regulator